MKWVHIDFWFETYSFRRERYLNKKQQREFELLLKDFISQCKRYINRKFYLYEDIPHCFLALELKSISYLPTIDRIVRRIQKPKFIYKMWINVLAGNDASNGDGFLDILNAFTDFYLFKRDNRITHIIHCCMEFMMQSRQDECKFYQNMAINYQVVKRYGKTLVYGYKKLTPKMRKIIRRYVNSLDLRRQKCFLK